MGKFPFRIGTGEECDLLLTNGHQVARQASITRGAGGFLLRDMGDGQAIRWNGKPIRQRLLRHGDCFEIGSPSLCQIRFLVPAPTKINRDLQNLKILVDITRTINSYRELDELLEKILEGVLQVTGAERGMVLLPGPEDRLRTAAFREKESGSAAGGDPRISHSIANEVARTGRSISVKDAQTHQDFRDRQSIMNLGLKTILCVPMNIHDRTIGVLYMDHRGIVENLALTDFHLVESFAATAAIAIENVRLVEEKVRTERLSAVGLMANALIHDIRGPMTSLQGFAELLKGQSALDEKGKHYVNTILREVLRLRAMATEVLDYSRGQTVLNRALSDVRKVIEEILPLLEPDLERHNVILDLDLGEEIQVAVDPVKMGRVLLNLVSNALDAMETGGRLRIVARAVPPHLLIEVTDTGCGIPRSIREKIWDPFFSHGKAHGTGLGMAIVQRVVQQHDGRIEIDSEEGRGTTVRIFLPLPGTGSA